MTLVSEVSELATRIGQDVKALTTAVAGKAAAAHSHLIGDLPVAASGTSSATALTRADDSRLSNSRTPTTHAHAIGDLPVASSGTLSTTQLVRADDARLSDTRTPAALTVVDGSVSASAAIAESKLALASDAVAATPSRRTLGTGATQAAPGNHTHTYLDQVVRTHLFGAVGYTEAPVLEMELTSQFTNLASADYLMGSQMTALVDTHTMLSTAFPFYRAVVPVAGRYDVEWVWHGTALPMAAKVCKNVPNGSTGGQAATGYSVMTQSQTAGAEQNVRIHQTVRLAAGDTLAFGLWCAATFNILVNPWGQARTRFAVRYVGPK